MTNIATKIPETFYQGTTIEWVENIANYNPDDGYTLKYNFLAQGGGGDLIQVSSTDYGDNRHLISISSSESGSFASSNYYNYQAYVEGGSPTKKLFVREGVVNIVYDYAASPTFDPRSHTKKVLDAIESLLEGKATEDVSNYSIANRSLTKMTTEELLTWRNKYRREYNRELQAKKLNSGDADLSSKIRIRF